MPPFYFLTFAKVSVSVSKKFGLKKVSVSVSKTFGLEKKSRSLSRKFWSRKKVSVSVSMKFFGLVTQCSDSLPELREWIFFIPFPFPNFGNGFFSFPSRSRILGMDFFIPFPFPNFGNGIFHSLPVPELTISKSGIKRENGLQIVRDASTPTFSASSTFHTT